MRPRDENEHLVSSKSSREEIAFFKEYKEMH
jgi:hypothetical protein